MMPPHIAGVWEWKGELQSPPRSRILVVDDEPAVCGLLQEFLQAQAFQVTTATSGKQALASTCLGLPDLILLDVYMPEMSGLDLLRHFRERWPHALPFGVIMLTGCEDERVLNETLHLGAWDVVRKPFDLTQLELALRLQLLLHPPHFTLGLN